MTVRLGLTAAALTTTLLATTAALPAAAAAPAAPAAAGVTVTIDPSYQQPEFQGWGTSLVWMAAATGNYPDEIRKKLVDLVFGSDGLNLNIARYNIGGGNAPTVRPYLRPGGAVPGFWKAPQAYTPADKEWWDPNNPQHWDLNADPAQRWWVDQIKNKITQWEAFSNSPPYFQTVSGYVSGGFDPNTDQIRADRVDQFADYLVRVTEHLEKSHRIKFDTIDPLNEPNTDYWRTTLGADGQPTGGRQEGAHAGPALQAQVVEALQRRLTAAKTDAKISAPDETNPGKFLTDWYGYTPAAQAAVAQLNVHTYGTGQRTAARDVAKAEQRPLWMSEVEGSWGNDYTSMNSGLGMAQRIIDDIRELEPSAWVLWQPIEDAKNMVAEGNLQWGSIHVPFDCTAKDTLKTCEIRTNTKFDTIRNFTHYIRPGDRFVKVDGTATAAAIKANGRGATVVHANQTTQERAVSLDLSKFGTVSRNATVTPVVTSAAGKLVKGRPVQVSEKRATLTVPAQSVTTFLIDGVSGIASAAQHLQDGHAYRITGVQSGRSFAGTTIRTTDPAAANQLWTFDALGNGRSHREKYVLTNAGTRQRLAVRNGAVVTEAATGKPDEGAQWVLSTTGDGTYTLINVAERRLLEVPGEATSDGAAVGLYRPTSGSNQRWAVRDESVVRAEAVNAYTVPGLVPQLPTTVTAVLGSGERRALPVTWQMPSTRQWREPGTVTVCGTATDVLGNKIKVTAEVTVDAFTATAPARAKAPEAGTPALPTTVIGLGRHGGRAELPVTWNAAPAGAFDRVGVVTLTGTATVVDGSTLPASVRVQVTEPTEGKATETGTTVAATFTEGGYSTAGLVNGDTTEKAWSNWKPSGRNASDTITVTLPRQRDVSRVVVHFYRDNGSGGGLAKSLRVGVPAADGSCTGGTEVPVGTSSPPAVSAPLSATTGKVCVVLTAVPDGYLTVSEIEVLAKVPGTSSDARLAGLTVDGTPVAGFDPAVTEYGVKVRHPEKAVVTATAADPYAEVVTSGRGSLRTITVTSEDGSATSTYRVRLQKR